MCMEEKDMKNKKITGDKEEQNGKTVSDEKVTITGTEYNDLKAKAQERDAFYDKYLRGQAELENAKKRLEKERADFIKYANESFVIELLPILDNLEMAEKHIKEAKDFDAVREGVDMIQTQIQKFLKDIGVERVKASGEKFDPNLHEPIETEESSDLEEGLIVEELKPGYKLNGRLLRPASVKVVKKKQ